VTVPSSSNSLMLARAIPSFPTVFRRGYARYGGMMTMIQMRLEHELIWGCAVAMCERQQGRWDTVKDAYSTTAN
jgi:hypothetical protein